MDQNVLSPFDTSLGEMRCAAALHAQHFQLRLADGARTQGAVA
jgi:hypothetical protein